MGVFLSLLLVVGCTETTLSLQQNDSVGVFNEPDIHIEPKMLIMPSVFPGCESDAEFTVSNVGENELEISDITLYVTAPADIIHDEWSTYVAELQIGEQFTVPLWLYASDEADDIATLEVLSNDPDEERALGSVTFPAGVASRTSETFIVEGGKSVDFLFIIDNSCSMWDEQQRLSNNSGLLIDILDAAKTDYRIGIITTDKYDLVGQIITPSTADRKQQFTAQIVQGEDGSSMEQGLLTALLATSAGGDASPGSDLGREDARQAFIWISDEPNRTYPDDTSVWITHFQSLKASPSEVVGWAIVGDPIVGCPTAIEGGDNYVAVATGLGGSWTSICSDDWSGAVTDIASAAGVDLSFELSEVPLAGTMVVYVNGSERSTGWTYDETYNAVVFNISNAPSVDAIVTVEYGYLGDCP